MLEDFISKYKKIFFEDFEFFFESLKKTNRKYFRVNTARNIDYLSEFENISLIKKVDGFEAYEYNESKIDVSSSLGFLTGGLYIQNISSLFPPRILFEHIKHLKNPIILDLCAAPGGKTTYISELLKRSGLIIANEISSKRLKALNFNITKFGSYNVKTVSIDGRIADKKLPPIFDAILLDAPCSNENKILKNDTVKSFWSEEFIKNMQSIQKDLIRSAFSLLKPGGFLAYSTCTFSLEENEELIEGFLAENTDAILVDINGGVYPEGLSGNREIDKKVIRVLPHIMEFDGFFIALIQKQGCITENEQIKSNEKFKEDIDIFDNNFIKNIPLQLKNNKVYINPLLQLGNNLCDKIRFQNTDFLLGQFIKDFVISTEASWEFGAKVKNKYRLQISYQESVEYLNGYDINFYPDIIKEGILYYKNIPVGPFKVVDKRIKNKLSRYFIYNRV